MFITGRWGKRMKTSFYALLIGFCAVVGSVSAQTTAFTYQGSLKDGAGPANGNYDFQFALYDNASGGTQLGPILTQNSVAVSGGGFTALLDFGNQFPGAARFLEIRVRLNAQPTFTILAPRQFLSSMPYSVKSLSASTADNAAALAGVAASQYVQTTDPRMSDSRSPTAGSGNYIQNQNAGPQATANFNISGTGTANFVNATTQFNLNNVRILSASGTENLFVGVGTGSTNTGNFNSFFGHGAGQANTTSNGNSFFGRAAGRVNTTGNENSFFGQNAGLSNTTGSGNAFFGAAAGQSNTTADANSFFGYASGVSNTTGFNNAFFGFDSGRLNSTGNTNSFFGFRAGQNNSTGSQNTFVGWTAGQDNTTSSFNSFFGYASGQRNTSGTQNAFFGHAAGLFNTTGSSNAFFGQGSGQSNTSGALNAFFGQGAGFANTNGNNNAFFGQAAGYNNTQGAGNSFFGRGAGFANTEGSNNTFVGLNAGSSNTSASNNTFVGTGAGQTNTSGISNSFFGVFAGFYNTTGLDNSFFGRSAGQDNTIGSANSFFGRAAGEKNSEGIDNSFVGGFAGFNNTFGSSNSFVGRSAGQGNTTGNENSFLGTNAGLSNSTGGANSFVGSGAGRNNTTAFENSFFGRDAGRDTGTGGQNSFVGANAGRSNTTGTSNSFFGKNAGLANVGGAFNTAVGANANVGAPNLTYATAIGADATVSTINTIALGRSSGQDQVVIPGPLVANLPAGDTDYIQNTTTPQSANFSVTGHGHIGGNLGLGITSPTSKLTMQTATNNYGLLHTDGTVTMGNYIGGAAGGGWLGTTTNHPLHLFANNSNPYLTVTQGGNVGIGTTTPQGKLQVRTDTNSGGLSHTDGTVNIHSFVGPRALGISGGWLGTLSFHPFYLYANNGNPSVTIQPDGSTETLALWVRGTTRLSLGGGGFDEVCEGTTYLAFCSSALRYKTNVRPFAPGMDFVNQLRPISYDWKDNGRKDTGFAAEDVEKIDPRFVTYNKEGQIEGVKYNRLSVAFVNAFKEQQAEIVAQKALIEQMQTQIELLRKLVCAQNATAEICRVPQ